MTGWIYEIYVKGPKGETGWNIEVGWVLNLAKATARPPWKSSSGILAVPSMKLLAELTSASTCRGRFARAMILRRRISC